MWRILKILKILSSCILYYKKENEREKAALKRTPTVWLRDHLIRRLVWISHLYGSQ